MSLFLMLFFVGILIWVASKRDCMMSDDFGFTEILLMDNLQLLQMFVNGLLMLGYVILLGNY
jgi:hypothetical protein